MLRIRMRRRLRQAPTFVSSGEHESDMSITLAARIHSPVSVFDPLGVFANSKRPSADPVKHYCEAELTHDRVAITHGRVAMFAGSSAVWRAPLAFSSQRQLTRLNAVDDDTDWTVEGGTGKGRLNRSVDQEGKSNGVEPKINVDDR